MTGQKFGISLRVGSPVRETMATFIPICDRDTENEERRIEEEEAAGIGFGCEGTGRPNTDCDTCGRRQRQQAAPYMSRAQANVPRPPFLNESRYC